MACAASLPSRASSDDALAGVRPVRTTVTLDDQLLAQAQELCGPVERTHLLKKALQALVERTRSGAGPGNQPS